MEVSTADLRDLFDYKPLTGELVLKTSRGGRRAGSVAGCVNKSGYVVVKVRGNNHQAHRIVWQWVHGEPPSLHVHHRARKTDNRIWNLEDITQRANLSIERTAKSGLPTGVNKVGGRYRAMISIDWKTKHLGMFDTPEEASKAYQSALEALSA